MDIDERVDTINREIAERHICDRKHLGVVLFDELVSTSDDEWAWSCSTPIVLTFKCVGCGEQFGHALRRDVAEEYAKRHRLRTVLARFRGMHL